MAKDATELGDERPFELNVGELPPPPPPSEEETAGGASPAGDPSVPPPAKGGKEILGPDWTHDDLQALIGMIRGPYDKLAVTTGDDWIRLDDEEALAMAVPMTMWMPVGWVRESGGRMSPMLGAVVTVAMLTWVNLPRVVKWNRSHPEYALDIDLFPGVRVLLARFKRTEVHRGGDTGGNDDRSRAAARGPDGDRGRDRGPDPDHVADAAPGQGRRHLNIDPSDLR